MQPLPAEFNPFVLMLDPQSVLSQIEHSERLDRLARRVCRPLDKPLLGGAAQSDEEGDAEAGAEGDAEAEAEADTEGVAAVGAAFDADPGEAVSSAGQRNTEA